jgi:hypothetical protein
LTPKSIQPKYAQIVASTWITSGGLEFLKNEKRFHTAWVIRDWADEEADQSISAVHRLRPTCAAQPKSQRAISGK